MFFLKERSSPAVPICAVAYQSICGNEKWRTGRLFQVKPFCAASFLISLFSVSRLFPLPSAFLREVGRCRVWRKNTTRRMRVEIGSANRLRFDLAAAHRVLTLSLRTEMGASDWRNENPYQLNPLCLPCRVRLPYETDRNILPFSRCLAYSLSNTNFRKAVAALPRVLNAMATTISSE